MMTAVEAEGQMTSTALANDARQELIKMLFIGENLGRTDREPSSICTLVPQTTSQSTN